MPQLLHVEHCLVISLAEKYEEKNEDTGNLGSWQGYITGNFISEHYLKKSCQFAELIGSSKA